MKPIMTTLALLASVHIVSAAASAQSLLPGEHDWMGGVSEYLNPAPATENGLCIDYAGNFYTCAKPFAPAYSYAPLNNPLYCENEIGDFEYMAGAYPAGYIPPYPGPYYDWSVNDPYTYFSDLPEIYGPYGQ